MKDRNMSFYQGVSYAFNFGSTGIFSRKTDEELIKDSLSQIVLTSVGSRVMRRNFGCGLLGSIFENMGPFLEDMITEAITDGITNYEPRVSINNITVDTSQDTKVVATIEYVYQGKVDTTNISIPNQGQ